MSPETTNWLEQKVPEFSSLSNDERNAIYDFSMLWSLFEGTKLNCYCNIGEIRKFSNALEQQGHLTDIDFNSYLQYLKNRYYVNGNLTSHFQHLHIERSGNPGEVHEALCNESASKKIKIIGCLAIIFRLRNNLFHGEKWQYQLQGQQQNFVNANRFLRNIMD